MASTMGGERASRTVVFYDGYCGLCDRLVQFLLTRDTQGRLRFATLQGAVARQELVPAGHDPTDVDTVLVVARFGEPEQHVLARSRAVLHAVSRLGGFWAALAAVACLVPASIADALYAAVARRRYRIFGRFDACPLPRPEWRERFLDDPSPPMVSRSTDG
jgi:predicted DCC family thiol-disulfide oxidoreductase YuxK